MQFPVWTVVLTSMATTVVAALFFRFFLLPSESTQQQIADRLWTRSEDDRNRTDRRLLASEEREARLLERIDDLETRIAAFQSDLGDAKAEIIDLKLQLLENGIEPKSSIKFEDKTTGTTINIRSGVEIGGDAVGRDKGNTEGGINFSADAETKNTSD